MLEAKIATVFFLVRWKANLLIFLSYVDGLVVNLLVNTKRASAVFIEKKRHQKVFGQEIKGIGNKGSFLFFFAPPPSSETLSHH